MLSYAEFIKEGYYDPDETHTSEWITTSKGYNIKLKATKFSKINDCIAAQAFVDMIDNDIAHASFRRNDDGTYYSMNAITNNNWQKRGIMTALYDFVEEKFNIKIVPSDDQDPPGEEFWKKRVIKEHNYSHLRKQSPLLFGSANSSSEMPIEGGCILITSKKGQDKLKRLYMGIIDKVINSRKVSFIYQYYVVKQYKDGTMWFEKVGLTEAGRKNVLNMNYNVLELTEIKTPLWEKSSTMSKENFFYKHQEDIKKLFTERTDLFNTQTDKPLPRY